jgi:serine/threonine protein kinase
MTTVASTFKPMLTFTDGNLNRHTCKGTLPDDYRSYLTDRGFSFMIRTPYLLIGDMPSSDGWLLHISIVKQQMAELLPSLLDYLGQYNYPFIIPVNKDFHTIILDGRAGLTQVGKVVSIYIVEDDALYELVNYLTVLTAGLKGPSIPTAVHVSQCLAISYGRFFNDPDLYMNRHYSDLFGYQAQNVLLQILADNQLKWPFKERLHLKKSRYTRLIKKQYVPIQSLKNDSKGNVIKCIKINRIYDMQWCVLKQGKKNQCVDDHGRDVSDRLSWQCEVHNHLTGKIPLSKVIEYFEINDDAYLAFEYIDGVPLSAKVSTLCQGVIWKALSLEIRREITGYLIQVIGIIIAFHQNGFIHRDINPGNFLVTDNGLVVPIDFELCYNAIEKQPSPPFTLGTPGYISPQQLNNLLPAIEDDIYSLGALIIKVLTGSSPSKLQQNSLKSMIHTLGFFLGYGLLSTTICACLNPDASRRPILKNILLALEAYSERLLTVRIKDDNVIINDQIHNEIQLTIQRGIKSLNSKLMTGDKNEWISKTQTSEMLVNQLMNYSWYPGFYAGASGILFTLSFAKKLGFEINSQKDAIYFNFDYLAQQTGDFKDLQPGLWHGSYGVGIVICSMMGSGLIDSNPDYIEQIHQLLSKPTNELSVANGLSGQGLSILYCQEQLQLPNLQDQLHSIISTIIKQQKKDGSWLLNLEAAQTKAIAITGFGLGVAGITYFLLQYYSSYEEKEVRDAIIKSLDWLIKNRIRVNSEPTWALNAQNRIVDPWLENGFSGVALTLIKAFELLQNPDYKDAAVSALLNHPRYISSNYPMLGNGLSGLGLVYLEAFKVFKDPEWKNRADHILSFLLHSYKLSDDDCIFWLNENDTRPTATLMEGNSGILHFLIRYMYPEKVGCPLF